MLGPGISIFIIISPGDSNVKPVLRTSWLEPTFWEKFPRKSPHMATNHPGWSLPHTFGPTAGHFGRSGRSTHGVSVSTEGPAQPHFSAFLPPPISAGGGVLEEERGAGEHSWDFNHLQPQKSISSHLSLFSPSKLSCRDKHLLPESNPEAPS